jgi:hypothetical protein
MTLLDRIEKNFFDHGVLRVDVLADRKDFRFSLIYGTAVLALYIFWPFSKAGQVAVFLAPTAVFLGSGLYQLKKSYPMIYGVGEFVAGVAATLINIFSAADSLDRKGRILLFIGSALLVKAGFESFQKGYDEHKKFIETAASGNLSVS